MGRHLQGVNAGVGTTSSRGIPSSACPTLGPRSIIPACMVARRKFSESSSTTRGRHAGFSRPVRPGASSYRVGVRGAVVCGRSVRFDCARRCRHVRDSGRAASVHGSGRCVERSCGRDRRTGRLRRLRGSRWLRGERHGRPAGDPGPGALHRGRGQWRERVPGDRWSGRRQRWRCRCRRGRRRGGRWGRCVRCSRPATVGGFVAELAADHGCRRGRGRRGRRRRWRRPGGCERRGRRRRRGRHAGHGRRRRRRGRDRGQPRSRRRRWQGHRRHIRWWWRRRWSLRRWRRQRRPHVEPRVWWRRRIDRLRERGDGRFVHAGHDRRTVGDAQFSGGYGSADSWLFRALPDRLRRSQQRSVRP